MNKGNVCIRKFFFDFEGSIDGFSVRGVQLGYIPVAEESSSIVAILKRNFCVNSYFYKYQYLQGSFLIYVRRNRTPKPPKG